MIFWEEKPMVQIVGRLIVDLHPNCTVRMLPIFVKHATADQSLLLS